MSKKISYLFSVLILLAFVLSPFQVVNSAQPTPPPPEKPVMAGGPGAEAEPMAKLDSELRSLAAKGGTEPVTVHIYAEAGADLSKVVEVVENLFPGQDIIAATYISYTSDQDVVGFQLNGSDDNTMLDGLPGM